GCLRGGLLRGSSALRGRARGRHGGTPAAAPRGLRGRSGSLHGRLGRAGTRFTACGLLRGGGTAGTPRALRRRHRDPCLLGATSTHRALGLLRGRRLAGATPCGDRCRRSLDRDATRPGACLHEQLRRGALRGFGAAATARGPGSGERRTLDALRRGRRLWLLFLFRLLCLGLFPFLFLFRLFFLGLFALLFFFGLFGLFGLFALFFRRLALGFYLRGRFLAPGELFVFFFFRLVDVLLVFFLTLVDVFVFVFRDVLFFLAFVGFLFLALAFVFVFLFFDVLVLFLRIGATDDAIATALEHLFDLLVERRELERLVHVRVRAVERRGHLVQVFSDPGEHQYAGVRERNRFADFPAHLPAAHAGHHHVENDEVRQVLVCELPRLIPISGLQNVIAFGTQMA